MGWRIVNQPNGKLGLFSDPEDDFTYYNMDREQAVVACQEMGLGKDAAIAKVQRGIDDIAWSGKKGSGLDRWNECIEAIKRVHGQKGVDELLALIEADDGSN
jgi:hypothetical protein